MCDYLIRELCDSLDASNQAVVEKFSVLRYDYSVAAALYLASAELSLFHTVAYLVEIKQKCHSVALFNLFEMKAIGATA